MSKYKKGDRFIIEINKVLKDGPFTVYKIKGVNWVYLYDAQLDRLEKERRQRDERLY